MTAKLRVRNFQSIADAKIEVEGLTVITGRSNLGKSALIRAASAMLFGNPGEHYIRRGEDWTGGALVIEDGQLPLKIVWRKVAANKRKPNLQPVLEINGQQHTKIGRDHKNLTAPFGISEIETTATRLRPQVAMQHDPIFLVTENETTAAEVFKLLGRVDVITEAQRMAKKDLKDTEDKRKIRAQDRNDAKTRAEELDHVPALRSQMEQIKAQAATTEALVNRQKTAADLLRELKTLAPRAIPTPPPAPKIPPNLTMTALLRELKTLAPRAIPTPPPAPKRTQDVNLTPLLRELITLNRDVASLEEAKDRNLTEQQKLSARKAELEDELKLCPTCKRPFDGHQDHHA